ncbi:MAG: hypothetical protein ABR95_06860 [Sphingobacteriales bacterium BACL12 MAG-120813-bin55]|jgi:hypothetical protein|nr:MAG: hypothetical protein ABR95_06860 [Sphingobacteriales bacterium BACL12 MAG-120813-bin55]
MKSSLLCMLLLTCAITELPAQHILTLMEGQRSPEAQPQDFAWLEGSWSAEIWDGTADEVWLPLAAEMMMGTFRFYTEGTIRFLELFTIRQEGNSVLLQVKHFNPDLTGWEDSNSSENFPLVYMEPHRAYFDGITYILRDPQTLDVYVLLNNEENDTPEEAVFHFSRR